MVTLWEKEKEIAEIETAIQGLQQGVNSLLPLVKDNPENAAELQPLINDSEAQIKVEQAKLANLLKEKAELEAQKKAAQPDKWSRENHPILGRKPSTQAPAGEAQTPNTFKVNDMVMARWINGDKQFYKAKITMVTGSASAPKFRVKFPEFNNDTDEGLSLADIKPIDMSKKRKAEEVTVPTPAPIQTATTNVISAAANIDTTLANQARQEPSKVSDGPPKPAKMARKPAAKKVLEKHQNNWKDFQAKGPKKQAKKESMFRTPDLPNARVGFTGSGRPMAKDPARNRHTYSTEDDRYGDR